MKNTSFINLRVYLLAEQLADEIWKTVCSWNSFEKFSLGKQLANAADAIGANIAEGAGRGSYKDNRRFVKIARGSLNETRPWLRRAQKRALLSDEEITKISGLLCQLAPMLNAYLNSIGSSSPKVSQVDPMTNDL